MKRPKLVDRMKYVRADVRDLDRLVADLQFDVRTLNTVQNELCATVKNQGEGPDRALRRMTQRLQEMEQREQSEATRVDLAAVVAVLHQRLGNLFQRVQALEESQTARDEASARIEPPPVPALLPADPVPASSDDSESDEWGRWAPDQFAPGQRVRVVQGAHDESDGSSVGVLCHYAPLVSKWQVARITGPLVYVDPWNLIPIVEE